MTKKPSKTTKETPKKLPYGKEINKTKLAEQECVSLTTVGNWIRRGCPHVKRDGNVYFNDAEVAVWRFGQDLLNDPKDREYIHLPFGELLTRLESAHSQLWLWLFARHYSIPESVSTAWRDLNTAMFDLADAAEKSRLTRRRLVRE